MRTAIQLLTVVCLSTWLGRYSLANEFVHIPAGEFDSVIPEGEGDNRVAVADFFIQEAPVTNAEFMRFVLHHQLVNKLRLLRVSLESFVRCLDNTNTST